MYAGNTLCMKRASGGGGAAGRRCSQFSGKKKKKKKKKNEDIMSFAGKLMELRKIILSKVTQTQKDM